MPRYPLADNGRPDVAELSGLLSVSICCASQGMVDGSYSLRGAYGWVYKSEADAGGVKLTFRLVMEGRWVDAHAVVPSTDGLFRVPVEGEYVTGWLTARGGLVEPVAGVLTELDGELEPATVAWVGFGVGTVRFLNEARISDPTDRVAPQYPAPVLVATVDASKHPLRFKSGYNCQLEYDPELGVLTLGGVPGGGMGKPQAPYWDPGWGVVEDPREGLTSVNGHIPDGEGRVALETGGGIQALAGDGALVFRSPIF